MHPLKAKFNWLERFICQLLPVLSALIQSQAVDENYEKKREKQKEKEKTKA